VPDTSAHLKDIGTWFLLAGSAGMLISRFSEVATAALGRRWRNERS
jgi:hypothetical protein